MPIKFETVPSILVVYSGSAAAEQCTTVIRVQPGNRDSLQDVVRYADWMLCHWPLRRDKFRGALNGLQWAICRVRQLPQFIGVRLDRTDRRNGACADSFVGRAGIPRHGAEPRRGFR